jgi:hypothetical protein
MTLRKGSPAHGTAGTVFCGSMLCMAVSGSYLAYVKEQMGNMLVGLLTAYLVSTAWWTGKQRVPKVGLFDWGALTSALALGAVFIFNGARAAAAAALAQAHESHDSDEAGTFYFFGGITLLAAVLDAYVIARGGVRGRQRIARHLWRMCVPMLIAIVSVVPRLHRLFPVLLSNTTVLYSPIIAVLVALIYFLTRVLLTGSYASGPRGSRSALPCR